MIGQDKMSQNAQVKILAERDAQILEHLSLFQESFRIDDTAAPDDADDAGVKNSGGNEMKNDLPLAHDDGMSGIVTAAVANHHVDSIG